MSDGCGVGRDGQMKEGRSSVDEEAEGIVGRVEEGCEWDTDEWDCGGGGTEKGEEIDPFVGSRLEIVAVSGWRTGVDERRMFESEHVGGKPSRSHTSVHGETERLNTNRALLGSLNRETKCDSPRFGEACFPHIILRSMGIYYLWIVGNSKLDPVCDPFKAGWQRGDKSLLTNWLERADNCSVLLSSHLIQNLHTVPQLLIRSILLDRPTPLLLWHISIR
jgi:hypothetical protein